MDGINLADPAVVRGIIAREWLRADAVDPTLGAVTLRPHQIDAVRRLRVLLGRHGGALLCDEVGLGKTYVALAVARGYERPLVVAPASLRDMWLAAAARCGIEIVFVSMESLSRSAARPVSADVLIVDEAHHFRTSATARFRSLVVLSARRPLLLVSATPLHNKREDLTALLSLFIGSAARGMPPTDLAHYVVRRDQREVAGGFPVVRPPIRTAIRANDRVLERLLELPPPTPPVDGGVAAAMVAHTLVRLWASSDAALREGLRRRLARTMAIRHSLEAGRHPTRRELKTWTYVDRTVQLGFAELLAPPAVLECAALLPMVIEHERALVDLLRTLKSPSTSDGTRVRWLRAIRKRHPRLGIVAFAQFAETVAMYYRGFAAEGRSAMLTSKGARIASGPIARHDALANFAPIASGVSAPKSSESISLLLATDLLSEGVNLQDAAVVVHLDLPWTAAALDQRVGRVARLGSLHPEVFVYAIDPPAPSTKLLRAEAIIRRKAALSDESVGASRIPPLFARLSVTPTSEVEENEALRRALTGWFRDTGPGTHKSRLCAAVCADRNAVLALVTVRGKMFLIAGEGASLFADVRTVRTIVEMASGETASLRPAAFATAIQSARRWIDSRLASDDAGGPSAVRSTLARQIMVRLAHELTSCPRHERAQLSARIATLHQRLQSPFALGIELEIDELLRSGASDFVAALENILAGCEQRENVETAIYALLVLRAGETSGLSPLGSPHPHAMCRQSRGCSTTRVH